MVCKISNESGTNFKSNHLVRSCFDQHCEKCDIQGFQAPTGGICPLYKEYNWHSIYKIYRLFVIWEHIFKTVADDPDLEYLMVDGSIVRVHQHGAAPKKLNQNRPEVDLAEG